MKIVNLSNVIANHRAAQGQFEFLIDGTSGPVSAIVAEVPHMVEELEYLRTTRTTILYQLNEARSTLRNSMTRLSYMDGQQDVLKRRIEEIDRITACEARDYGK